MLKYGEKLPLLNHRNKPTIKKEIEGTVNHVNSMWRSNTEPIDQLLKIQLRSDNGSELTRQHNASVLVKPKSPHLSPPKKARKASPLKLQEDRDIEMLQYRKSIKQLINIFEEKSNELKSLNINCYVSSPSPKNHDIFNDLIIKEVIKEVEDHKRHRSKLLHLKKKLRKSLMRAEDSEAQQQIKRRRNNITQLKKVLSVHSPYSEERKNNFAYEANQNSNKMLLLPNPEPSKRDKQESSLYSKRKLKELIVDRSKRTTIGGWKFDIFETNYPM